MESMPRRHACPNAVQAGAPLPAGAAAAMGLETSRGASFGWIPGPAGVEGPRPRHGSLQAGAPFNPAATMGLEAFHGAAFGGIPSPAAEEGARSSFIGSGVQAGASDPAVHGMAGRRSSLARHIVHWGSVPANASPELIQKRTMGALAACIMEMQDNAERMRKLMSQYKVVHEFVPRHVVNELFVKLDEMADSLKHTSLQCQEALDANPRSPSEPEEEDEYLQDDASWCAENDIDFEEILDRRMN